MNNETKTNHLQMIQNIITRMASNSFALKGWAVTIIAGIFALSGKENNPVYCLVSLISTITFWLLDSYYLQQERLYRSLYKDVQQGKKEADFSMEATVKLYPEEENKYKHCAWANTEKYFYIPLVAACFVVTFLKIVFENT